MEYKKLYTIPNDTLTRFIENLLNCKVLRINENDEFNEIEVKVEMNELSKEENKDKYSVYLCLTSDELITMDFEINDEKNGERNDEIQSKWKEFLISEGCFKAKVKANKIKQFFCNHKYIGCDGGALIQVMGFMIYECKKCGKQTNKKL